MSDFRVALYAGHSRRAGSSPLRSSPRLLAKSPGFLPSSHSHALSVPKLESSPILRSSARVSTSPLRSVCPEAPLLLARWLLDDG
jgi:hypothetical protein